MLKLIAYETITIRTQLSRYEIIEKLKSVLEPGSQTPPGLKRLFSPYPADHRRYRGRFSTDTFKLIRIIHHRNSFLPVICGRINAHQIELNFRLPYAVAVFVTCWLMIVGLVAFFTIGAVIAALKNDNPFTAEQMMTIVVPIALFVFGFSLTTISFSREVRKEKTFLTELFVVKKISL